MEGKDVDFCQQVAGTLNRTEQLILALRYGDDLSPGEIGAVLGLSIIEVRRALDDLRRRVRVALAVLQPVSSPATV